MSKMVMTALVCLLAQQTLSADFKDKPSSFVPRAHAKQHIYGSPLQPAKVGHAKKRNVKPSKSLRF
jgi:hypothetical protein